MYWVALVLVVTVTLPKSAYATTITDNQVSVGMQFQDSDEAYEASTEQSRSSRYLFISGLLFLKEMSPITSNKGSVIKIL